LVSLSAELSCGWRPRWATVVRELTQTLADALIERVEIDWASAEAFAQPSDTTTLRALREIATLAGGYRAIGAVTSGEAEGVSAFIVLVAALAALVTAVAILGTLVQLVFTAGSISPQLVIVLSFAGTAAVLLRVGHRTTRVADYAALCLVSASAFS